LGSVLTFRAVACGNILIGYGLVPMSRYVLDHHLEGEKKRLALMSQLLDPMHRRHIESLGISREARVLEVGCGNPSMSAWMAEHIALDGQIVALDLDLSLVDNVRAPGVEFRQGDIVTGPVDPGRFDFVTARAVLHHVADAKAAGSMRRPELVDPDDRIYCRSRACAESLKR
jgi:2-polyprenyl-3-methyl-5-hydroxy-6-metoxy-1,4-benzoquinol methylase